jgi:hypothetical protein
MDSPEKLATYGKQDEERLNKNNTICIFNAVFCKIIIFMVY